MIKTIEDTIQKEHDALLRKMNSNKVEDKTTRQLLVQTRDAGYDFFNDHLPHIDNKTKTQPKEGAMNQIPDANDAERVMITATKYITQGLMQAGRYV